MAKANIATAVASHVNLLTNELGEETGSYEHVSAKLKQLENSLGEDGQLHILTALLDEVSSGRGASQTENLLQDAVYRLSASQPAGHTFATALLSKGISWEVARSKLDLGQELELSTACALVGQHNSQLNSLEVAVTNLIQSGKASISAISPELIHEALVLLRRVSNASSGFHTRPGDLYDGLVEAVAAHVPIDSMPVNLRCQVFNDKPSDEVSISSLLDSGEDLGPSLLKGRVSVAAALMDLGYACTCNMTVFNRVLSVLPPLDGGAAMEVAAMMARTQQGGLELLTTSVQLLLAYTGTGGTNAEAAPQWDIELAADQISLRMPPGEVERAAVSGELDRWNVTLPTLDAFGTFASMYHRMSGKNVPQELFCKGLWENNAAQMQILEMAISSTSKFMSFQPSPEIDSRVEALPAATSSAGSGEGGVDRRAASLTGGVSACWRSVQVMETLMRLVDIGHGRRVLEVLERAMGQSPETVAISFSETERNLSPNNSEILSHIVRNFVMAGSNEATNVSFQVLQEISKLRPRKMKSILIDVNARNEVAMPKVLDICNELKMLTQTLEGSTFTFAINLAALASMRELLNLSKWTKRMLESGRSAFSYACTQTIEKFCNDNEPTTKDASTPHVQSAAVLLRSLVDLARNRNLPRNQPQWKISQRAVNEIERVFAMATSMHPALSQILSNDDEEAGGPDGTFPQQVEEEANEKFRQLYSEEIAAEDFIMQLSNETNQGGAHSLLLSCVIRNLLDESRFLEDYPEKELMITASLLGSLVNSGLLKGMQLGLATRVVLDALRTRNRPAMFLFGIEALSRFQSKVQSWPSFRDSVMQIDKIREYRPDIVSNIQGGSENEESSKATTETFPSANQPIENVMHNLSVSAETGRQKGGYEEEMQKTKGPGNMTASAIDDTTNLAPGDHLYIPKKGAQVAATSSKGVKFNSKNVATMVSAPENLSFKEPESSIADRVGFAFNNMTRGNFEAKSEELLNLIEEKHVPWFANYLVVRRVATELNHHSAYLQLVEKMPQKTLMDNVLDNTYINIKILLRNEKIRVEPEERTLLKNLAHWLGQLTIARNRPVLQRKLDLRRLLSEGYVTGRLIAVLPFVSKIIDTARKSKIFKPPNPWTTSILSTLVEIYQTPELKLNNKFEIEGTFSRLEGVTIEGVTPSKLVRNLERDMEDNPDFSAKTGGSPTGTPSKQTGASNQPMLAPQNSRGLLGGVVSPQAAAALTQHQPQLQGVGQQSQQLQQPSPPPLNSQVSNMMALQGNQPPSPMPHYSASQPSQVGGQSPEPGPQPHDSQLQSQQQQQQSQPPPPGYSPMRSMYSQPPAARARETVPPQSFTSASEQQSSQHNQQQQARSTPSELITVNPHLSTISDMSQLHQILERAVSATVNEALQPVLERSVKVACNTTQYIVQRDLALEADESKVRRSAMHMVSHLSGGLALVTVREWIKQLLVTKLRQAFSNASNSIGADVSILEQAVQMMTNENVEVCCALVEQTAVERAAKELDDTLRSVYEQRKRFRANSSPNAQFFDSTNLSPQRFHDLPEMLRPQPMHSSTKLLNVYDRFDPQPQLIGRVQRARQESSSPNQSQPPPPPTMYNQNKAGVAQTGRSQALSQQQGEEGRTREHAETMDPITLCMNKMDNALRNERQMLTIDDLQADHLARQAIADLQEALQSASKQDEMARNIVKRAFTRACDTGNQNRLLISCLISMASVGKNQSQRLSMQVPNEFTNWLIHSEESVKHKLNLIIELMRRRLMNISEYETDLSHQVRSSKGALAAEFSFSLINEVVVKERIISVYDLPNVLDTLYQIAQFNSEGKRSESVSRLIESAVNASKEREGRQTTTSSHTKPTFPSTQQQHQQALHSAPHVGYSRGSQPGGYYTNLSSAGTGADQFSEMALSLFEEWMRICADVPAGDTAYLSFFAKLQARNAIMPEKNQGYFFAVVIERAVLESDGFHGASAQPADGGTLDTTATDALIRLVMAMTRTLPEATNQSGESSMQPRLNVLSRFLLSLTNLLRTSFDHNSEHFNQRPFLRIFSCLLSELHAPDSNFSLYDKKVVAVVGSALLSVQPRRVPGFAQSYIDLVSHRCLLHIILREHSKEAWPLARDLYMSMFKFLEPFLQTNRVHEPILSIYKATIRLVCITLHDFSSFLVENHASFVNEIPLVSVQLRNLILSASPEKQIVPSPSTPNLKVDLIPEISVIPLTDRYAESALDSLPHLRSHIDSAISQIYEKSERRQLCSLHSPQTGELLEESERAQAMQENKVDGVDRIISTLLKSQNKESENNTLSDGCTAQLEGPHVCGADMQSTHIQIGLLNATVTNIGRRGIHSISPGGSHGQQKPVKDAAESHALSLLSFFLSDEGAYFFFNALADHLRYPNRYTHFFSCLYLHIFQISTLSRREIGARVLVERLLAHKPHPWGVYVTVIELMRNRQYALGLHDFTKVRPEIDSLLVRIASGLGHQAQEESQRGPSPQQAA